MNKLLILFCLLSLTGCVANKHRVDKGDYYVDRSFPSENQNNRVRFLVFHYTAADDKESLADLTHGAVSSHYLIPGQPEWVGKKPVIFQLVPEERRAWHAGISSWNGRVNLNDTSIGIEIVNRGFTVDKAGHVTWYPFAQAQIAALQRLAQDIINRYQITPDNVLGHSDIAPLRKSDPGKLFPWQALAGAGIGAWPDAGRVKFYLAERQPSAPGNIAVVQQALAKYGYDAIPQSGELDEETRQTVRAFQMHFRPADISGNIDAETEAIALALVEKYRQPLN